MQEQSDGNINDYSSERLYILVHMFEKFKGKLFKF